MSKANLSTDGGIPIGLRSEFYIVTSSGVGDYQPIDLSGAREVVFRMNPNTADGWLSNQQSLGGGVEMALFATDQPIVMHSNDDRLWFVSQDAVTPANLYVWVIR